MLLLEGREAGDHVRRDARRALVEGHDVAARPVAVEDRHDDARQIAHRPAAGAAVQIDQRVGRRALRVRLQHRES